MARVVFEQVSKVFPTPTGSPVTALRDFSLAIEPGEYLVLLGHSGSGKTTALRLIAGLERVSRGRLLFDTQEMDGTPPGDRDVALVFQHQALYPHLTVRENLGFGLKLRHVRKEEARSRVEDIARLMGLTALLERLPATLSGGQRQRVALGRALVRQPAILLLDEPLANLDAPARAQMRFELARLHRQLGTTFVHVTHDQGEAMALGSRIAVLHEGVLQQIAEPLTLYREPANVFVAGFVGSPAMNLVRGEWVDQEGELWFVEQPALDAESSSIRFRIPEALRTRFNALPGKPVTCGVRPEGLHPVGADDGEVVFAGTVEHLEPLGAEVHVHVRTGTGGVVVARWLDASVPASGTRIELGFKVADVRFFAGDTGEAVAT